MTANCYQRFDSSRQLDPEADATELLYETLNS